MKIFAAAGTTLIARSPIAMFAALASPTLPAKSTG